MINKMMLNLKIIFKIVRYFTKILKMFYNLKFYDHRFQGLWQSRSFNDDDSVNLENFEFFKNYCYYSSYYFNETLMKWILIENSRFITKYSVSDNILNIEKLGKYKFEFISETLLLNDEFYISSKDMKEVLEYELLKYSIENNERKV